MTVTDLLDLIRNGESSGVEFKRDTIEIQDLAREVVAFANFQGGSVLLGVEDDGSISGITRPRPELEEWVMQACRDKIRPELIPYYELIKDVERAKDVAVVRVERGWTAHAVWHNQRNWYYIRVGTLTREPSREELERLFQQRGGIRFEVRPVSGSSIDDLDLRRIRDYFVRLRQQEVPDDGNQDAWIRLLINTEFLSEGDEAAPATVAGLLLFGRNVNKFLPQAGIDAVAYTGVEKDYATRERAPLRGPLTPLIGDGGLVDNGLVEQAVEFVRRNTNSEASLADGARRVDRRDYPEDAVREALVNALVHRDYMLSATDVELSLYSDRLEVVSPGRLPNDITIERMRAGTRAARNQLLKDVMRDYGYLEHMGMGVPRKIIRGMREHNGTEPDLIETDERFTVRLWKTPPATKA